MPKLLSRLAQVYYRWMDRLFDPPPEELRKAGDKAGIKLYYESQSEDEKRCKYRSYCNFLLSCLKAFIFGLLTAHILKL